MLGSVLARVTRRQVNLAGFAGCVALMGCALLFEHVMKLAPCNMCMLQRVAVIELGVVFLLAAVHNPGRIGARVYGLLILVAASVLIALSARHVWMQMQPPGSLPSCGADFYTMVDMLPFNEVVTRIVNGGGECQAILWSLFGISMPGWLLVCGVVFGVCGVGANFSLERARS